LEVGDSWNSEVRLGREFLYWYKNNKKKKKKKIINIIVELSTHYVSSQADIGCA